MIWDINAGAWIRVFVPRASDSIVLLENDEWQVGLLQFQCHAKACEPGADDHNVEVLDSMTRVISTPIDAAPIKSVFERLFNHKLAVVGRHVRSDATA